MPRIKYVGPIVGVDIPLVGLEGVQPGDVFDATEEQAAALLELDIYAPATDDAQEG